ncbi:Male sterility, NAD-binding protein [Niveomyces insectorum RCEF 264]|uniref:Male sterility, NAD-binding protein n=1 Tax=Niveomyces insectorum RCEF 264 TaxID=1081102 RepID=A0A167QUH8_9HYPO|nr:Male sterility, NAD-binding protein [Niveomyces insectorum RCEF 264]
MAQVTVERAAKPSLAGGPGRLLDMAEPTTGTAQTSSPSGATKAGPIGERLVVHLVDELAQETPERIWATVTRSPSDIEEGFRDITFAQCASAVNATAWAIETQVGGASRSFDVLAYLGVSDVRYAIYLFAAIKTGHQLMIPSVRNSLQQSLAVFEEASCNLLYYTPEMATVVRQLQDARPGLRIFEVPALDSLLSATSKHYPYDKKWADARTDPIIIAHSSGSTGNPKPTTITNGVYSAYDNHRKAEKIPGRLNQSYELLNRLAGERLFNPFPPFHASLFAMSIMPVFYPCIVTTGPPEKPPSGALLNRAMQMLTIRAAWCPPAIIEQLVDQPGGFEQVAKLDWIMYTGGPLAPAVGDRICRVTNVCQLYGSTETGPHLSLVPLPKNWSYFEWHPAYENEMDDMGDGTFEMVVHKDPALDWIRHFSQAYPDIETWRTRDLFIRSPHNPKLWRFVGRRDDVLVLSNGEKFNPVDMEGVVTGHPLVRGALIVGTARFQASLVIEPMEPLTVSEQAFVDQLWPTIEKANSVGPAHGRIFRSKVVVAGPDKPFIRAGKGTVIRARNTKLFEDEVDALYRDDSGGTAASSTVMISEDASLDVVTNFVRTCVRDLLPSTVPLSDTDDFFALGLDSLQTLELIKLLRRSIATQAKRNDIVSTRSVYAHPTIETLSRYLHGAISGQAIYDGNKTNNNSFSSITRVQAMAHLIDKYTSDLPSKHTRSGSSLCVAVTGTTGSLGTHILEALVNDDTVRKIYCLNRSPDAQARQERGFSQLGKQGLLASAKAAYLQTNFNEPRFGLAEDAYSDLCANVDVVIHNAWKVDFNHQLGSFEHTHIRGVRRLVDFALSSPRQPHIFYVSSLSSVGNWPAIYGTAQPVPETYADRLDLALPMGYGESKLVAEQIVRAAVAQTGVHATILRVGQIAGPLARDGGQWNPTEWLPSLIRSAKTLGCIPDAMNTIDWIPVDTLAHIVRDLVHSDYAGGRSEIYNLANPNAANWADLVRVVQAHWWPAETKPVPFAAWLDALQTSAKELDPASLPAIKIVDFYKELAAEAALPAKDRIAYKTDKGRANSATMAGLGAVDGKAMETWLQQWKL